MRRDSPRPRQLAVLLFLTLALDMVVRPFTQGAGPAAQAAIPAACLAAAAAVLAARALFACAGGPRAAVLRKGKTRASRFFLALCAAAFALGMGACIQRAERFFRYVSDEPMPRLVVYGLLFAVSFYAMRSGLETVLRLSGLLAWLFAAATVLLLLSNAGQMRLENLPVEAFDVRTILRGAAAVFTLSPAVALYFFWAVDTPQESRCAFGKAVLCLCGFFAALTLAAQLVLGARAAEQLQTAHTLSRLGRLSVFRRMDAVQIAVWMMLAFAKAAALGTGAQAALAPLMPAGRRRMAGAWALAAGAAGALCANLLSESALQAVQTAATAAVLTVLCAAGWQVGRHNEKKDR